MIVYPTSVSINLLGWPGYNSNWTKLAQKEFSTKNVFIFDSGTIFNHGHLKDGLHLTESGGKLFLEKINEIIDNTANNKPCSFLILICFILFIICLLFYVLLFD